MKKVGEKVFLFFLLGCFAACAHKGKATQQSCRAVFEKNFEVNVQGFMRAMPADMDSVTARKLGECVLNRYYEIDSTFILKEGTELEQFFRTHPEVYEACDSMIRAAREESGL